MRSFIGAVLGLLAGAIAFLVLHYEQLLLVAERKAGLLLTIQLNQAVDMYLFGGMIIGAIIGLSSKSSKTEPQTHTINVEAPSWMK